MPKNKKASHKKKYSAEALVLSERNILGYKTDLEIEPENLTGKTILDIGSGYGKFQKDCKEMYGIDVIALDPLYAYPKYANEYFEEFLKIHENRENKIAGINEVLPFVDNSFDLILSEDSSFYYSDTNYRNLKLRCEMVKQMFEEILRVLKPGGEAHIGEIRKKPNDQEFYESLLRKLTKKYDSKFSWRFVTTNIPHYLVLYKEQNFD